MIAFGSIADAGSLPLVVSNLVNIVVADYVDIGFARYAVVMVPVGLVSVAASLVVLLLFFGKVVPATYDTALRAEPATAVRDRTTFRAGWVVLGFLLVGYVVAEPLHLPLSVVAGAGALVLTAVASRRPPAVFSRSGSVPAVVGGGPGAGTPVERIDVVRICVRRRGSATGATGLTHGAMVSATGIGSDLGPTITLVALAGWLTVVGV